MTTPEQRSGGTKETVDAWARAPINHAKFARENAAALNLNPARLIIGHTLSTIMGDDDCAFSIGRRFSKKLGLLCGERLQIRLNWEIDTPELPEEVRVKLSEVRDRISGLDMGKYQDFLKAQGMWFPVARFVTNLVHSSPQLKSDIDYWINSQYALATLRKENPPV